VNYSSILKNRSLRKRGRHACENTKVKLHSRSDIAVQFSSSQSFASISFSYRTRRELRRTRNRLARGNFLLILRLEGGRRESAPVANGSGGTESAFRFFCTPPALLLALKILHKSFVDTVHL